MENTGELKHDNCIANPTAAHTCCCRKKRIGEMRQ
jgi:hypothetical protein